MQKINNKNINYPKLVECQSCGNIFQYLILNMTDNVIITCKCDSEITIFPDLT
jgi:hypothetical protein